MTSICHIGRPISQWQSIRCLIYICGMDDYGRKRVYIHCFISTHSPATCWFIAVVYMFLVNILLFGDPRTCRYCLVFFIRVYIHVCCLLVVFFRMFFDSFHLQCSTLQGYNIHSYRSRFFVMKFWIFGVHGNHCLLSTKSSMASLLSQLPIYIMHLFFPIKSPIFYWDFPVSLVGFLLLDPLSLGEKTTDVQAMQCSTMSGCTNDMARGSAVENFLSWVEVASRKTEDIRLEHNLRSPRTFEFLDLKMFPNI